LTYQHADFPAAIDVTTCSLDDPEAFPPADHLFVSHRLRWLQVNDHLPAHETIRTAAASTPLTKKPKRRIRTAPKSRRRTATKIDAER